MVVLDAVHQIQADQAPDLACRWNCKAGKCGSCSAEINGRPRLLCMTRMSTFGETDTITIAPLRTFPVIRDLVTDVSYGDLREPGDFSFSIPGVWDDATFTSAYRAASRAGATPARHAAASATWTRRTCRKPPSSSLQVH